MENTWIQLSSVEKCDFYLDCTNWSRLEYYFRASNWNCLSTISLDAKIEMLGKIIVLLRCRGVSYETLCPLRNTPWALKTFGIFVFCRCLIVFKESWKTLADDFVCGYWEILVSCDAPTMETSRRLLRDSCPIFSLGRRRCSSCIHTQWKLCEGFLSSSSINSWYSSPTIQNYSHI